MQAAILRCQQLVFSNNIKAYENCINQANYSHHKKLAVSIANQNRKLLEAPTAQRLMQAQFLAAYPSPRIASNPYKPQKSQQISPQNAQKVLHQLELEHIRATNQRVLQENPNSPFLRQSLFDIEKSHIDNYNTSQKINLEQRLKLQEYAKANNLSHYQQPVAELLAAAKLNPSFAGLVFPTQLDRSDASNPYTKYVKGYTPFRSDFKKGLERVRTNSRIPNSANGYVTSHPIIAQLSEDIYNSTFVIDQETRNAQFNNLRKVQGASQQLQKTIDQYLQAAQQFHREKPEYRKSATNPYRG
jgi:hypothetical protein